MKMQQIKYLALFVVTVAVAVPALAERPRIGCSVGKVGNAYNPSDPTCNSYMACTGSAQGFKMDCGASGLVYVWESDSCEYSGSCPTDEFGTGVPGTEGPLPYKEGPIFGCTDGFVGNRLNPADPTCRTYMACTASGQGFAMPCPSDLIFDWNSGNCQYNSKTMGISCPAFP